MKLQAKRKGFGPNLACICANDNFFLNLEKAILLGTMQAGPFAYTAMAKTPPGPMDKIIYFGASPLDIATNIAILILTIPYLRNLQMPILKKIATMGILIIASLCQQASLSTKSNLQTFTFFHLTYHYNLQYLPVFLRTQHWRQRQQQLQ